MTKPATNLDRPYRIVIGLDRSEYASIVRDHAIDTAVRHARPELHFVTVLDARADAEQAKQELAALVFEGLDGIDCADWRARLHVRGGRPYEEITGLAAEIRADLIVIGRFGLHHPGKRLGSVASRVLDAASCPTLVVGLVDQSPDAVAQCGECVRVRADSDGERWFCSAHSAPDRVSIATTLLPSGPWSGGGLMW